MNLNHNSRSTQSLPAPDFRAHKQAHYMLQVLKERKAARCVLPAPSAEPRTVAERLDGAAHERSANDMQVATLLLDDHIHIKPVDAVYRSSSELGPCLLSSELMYM